MLDLVPQSAVKVNDVTVGAVDDDARCDGWHARVHAAAAQTSVQLPDNAVAELRQTSLLGEKFVSLSPPTGRAAAGPARRRRHHPAAPAPAATRRSRRSSRALSLVLNGGGVAQLKTINVS